MMRLSLIALPIALAILKVAVVACLGWLLARRNVLHDGAISGLSDLVIKLAVPCLVFVNAARGSAGITGGGAVAMVVAGPLVLAVGYVISVALAKLLRVEPGYRKAVVAASTFQNSAYLPLAVGVSTAGLVAQAAGLSSTDASTLVVPGGNLASSTAGMIVVNISLFGVLYSPIFWGIGLSWLTDKGAPAPSILSRAMLIRMLPPPVVGLILGYAVGLTPLHLLLTPAHAPLRFAFDAIGDVASITVPLALLVLGAMLARAGAAVREPARNIAIVLATRFLLTPAIFLAAVWLLRGVLRHSPSLAIAAFVIFLESVTPPATNLAVMTRAAGQENGTSSTSSSTEESGDHTSEAIPRILFAAYVAAMFLLPPWLAICLRLLGR